jgi:glycosyltransferase involved in cell wall biosynthesis
MKIILLASTTWNLYNSRLGLAKALHKDKHDVILLSPRDEFTDFLIEEGLHWVHFPLKPRGRNILQELGAILFLISFYWKEKPDLVNHYTPKGVIYGSIAAYFAGIKQVVNTITGLGYVFSGNASSFLRQLVTILYRLVLRNSKVVFQNPDNQKYFVSNGFVSTDKSYLIPGSGVDMNRFVPTPEPEEAPPVVILPSRFVEEKGIRCYVKAARLLKSQDFPIRIVLVGMPELDQPTAIQPDEITSWMNEGLVEWWGWHNQMEKIYPLSHIVCLPTYYMEGIPKSLIEAAASGRPLIATDVPGCREIVHQGENGLLVPVNEPKALANAIMQLAENPKLRAKMGKKSREIAVSGFSIEKVVELFYKVFGIT